MKRTFDDFVTTALRITDDDTLRDCVKTEIIDCIRGMSARRENLPHNAMSKERIKPADFTSDQEDAYREAIILLLKKLKELRRTK